MTKRDEKGRFVGIEDAPSGADGGKKRVEHGKPMSGESFDQAFDQPGLTDDEGATLIEDIVADDPATTLEGREIPEDFPEGSEGDPEVAREALDKLRESGDPDDAAEALEALDDLDGSEGEDAPEGEEGEADERYLELTEEELSAKVTVKVDGEEVAVSLQEALNGYSRQADYSRKTDEVAREREAVQETRSELDARLEAAQQRLALLDHAMGAELSPQQKATLAQTYQQVAAERQALQAHQLQEVLPREHEALKSALGWESEEDVESGKRFIARAVVEEYGFEPSDLQNIHDHRLLVLAHDAAKYRELADQQEQVKRDVRGKRRSSPTLTPGSAGSETASARKARKAKKAMKQLGRSGSVDAAADAILSSGLADDLDR